MLVALALILDVRDRCRSWIKSCGLVVCGLLTSDFNVIEFSVDLHKRFYLHEYVLGDVSASLVIS